MVFGFKLVINMIEILKILSIVISVLNEVVMWNFLGFSVFLVLEV